MSKENLSLVRRSLAELLSAATARYFPKCKILNGGITDTGFYYDFYFSEEITSSHLQSIEEKMSLLISEGIEIKALKMVGKNAVEYLKHINLYNEEILSKIGLFLEDLITLVQINGHVNILEGEIDLLNSFEEIKNFKIFNVEKVEGEENQSRTRIFGAYFEDFSELKNYLKLQKKYLESTHLAFGKEESLFYPLSGKYSSFYVWDERGMIIKNTLLYNLKSELINEKFIEIQTPELEEEGNNFLDSGLEKESLSLLLENKGLKLKFPLYAFEQKEIKVSPDDLFFGLFRSIKKSFIEEYILCKEEDLLNEVISSLKFILKILKIYGFNSYRVILRNFRKKIRGPGKPAFFDIKLLEEALEKCAILYEISDSCYSSDYEEDKSLSIGFFLEDGQRWFHRGPNLKVELFSKKGDSERTFLIKRSSLGAIDDLIALLLEKENGELPFRINPEQVRIICLDSLETYAEHIKDLCESANIRAKVDKEDGPLSRRVHLAMKDKVSFVVVVGEKEKKAQGVAFRRLGECQMEQMSIDSFIKKLEDIL